MAEILPTNNGPTSASGLTLTGRIICGKTSNAFQSRTVASKAGCGSISRSIRRRMVRSAISRS